ncbi:MAG: GtrA family protein [Terriglobales bacterium]
MNSNAHASRIGSLTRHIPPQQFGRYLLVGVGNTLFGYGTFALFTALLDPVMAYGYVVASIVTSVVNITVACFGYKKLVFKTKGNYLREWARCVVVYSGGIAFNALALPVLVFAIRRMTSLFTSAPYIAGAFLMALTAVYSFLAHKNFSFRPAENEQEPAALKPS